MIHRYTVEQAADLLGCDPETVSQRIACGDLPGVKFGRGWIIPAQALDQRLNEMALEQAAERRKLKGAEAATTHVIVRAQGKRRARTPPRLPSV